MSGLQALARIGAEGTRRVSAGVVVGAVSAGASAVTGLADAVTTAAALAGADVARNVSPAVALRAGLALARHGLTPAAACAVNAARFPDEAALVDDLGTISFAGLQRRVCSTADAFLGAGVGRHDRVGVLCRNHRGFVVTLVALADAGADVVLLNTSNAAPQTAAVAVLQGLTGLVFDDEFAEHARAAEDAVHRLRLWRTHLDAGEDEAAFDGTAIPASVPRRFGPRPSGRFVLLTSGSTGAPKGAARGVPRRLDPLVAMLTRIPMRSRDVTLVGSPLFHAWGFGQLGLGLVLSSTVVVQRRFDAEAVLASVQRHRVRVLTVVPVMLKRLVELPEEVRRRYDTSSLAVVVTSGAPLSGALARRFMDAFGDVLYNVYGSTETGWGTIATPRDLRRAPGTAGTAPWRTDVRIVDDDGRPRPEGETGRIVVRNHFLLDQYTDGGRRQRLEGFMPTGDVGHLDEAGQLFVEGRDDDMIVSGGENVYPLEIEELLAGHPDVAEVAVVAVDDPEFGQRLRALVVRRPGAVLSEDDVRDFVRSRLARFKAPREVRFVDALPHNEVGKLVRSDPLRN